MPQGHIKLGSIDAVNLKTQGIDTPAIGNNQVTEGKLTPELRAQIAARTLPTNTIRLGEQLVRNGTFNAPQGDGFAWNEGNTGGLSVTYAGGVARVKADFNPSGTPLPSFFIQNSLPIKSFPKLEGPSNAPQPDDRIGTAMGLVFLLRFRVVSVFTEANPPNSNNFIGLNAILGLEITKSIEYSATSPFIRHAQWFESLMVMGYPIDRGGEAAIGFFYSLIFKGAPETTYEIADVTLHRLKTGRT